ncbi:MAG TPA: hypothetical protein VFU93_03195 [Acidimicrobiales bacterium]|nr:hypothetical protein [Acidimicrobiales bacterium]
MPSSIQWDEPSTPSRRAQRALGALATVLAALALLLGPGATMAVASATAPTESAAEETEKAEEESQTSRRNLRVAARAVLHRQERRPSSLRTRRRVRPRTRRPSDVLATPHLALRGPPND